MAREREREGLSSRWSFLVLVVAAGAMATMAERVRAKDEAATDQSECADQFAGLATCLEYVQGNAKAPTPDCCTGLKQVLRTNKTCLCVVVRDRNDPKLGLNINASLALALPSACKVSANVSRCPGTLISTIYNLSPTCALCVF